MARDRDASSTRALVGELQYDIATAEEDVVPLLILDSFLQEALDEMSKNQQETIVILQVALCD